MEKKFPIKSECASCGKKFANNEENYQIRGNYCSSCCSRIDEMMEWRRLRHKETRTIKQEKKFLELTYRLLKYWGIIMEENDRKFQGFKNYFGKVFQSND